MADSESGYQVGPGRPPLHSFFEKGQSGNPGGRCTKSLLASLADALNETVVVTIDGQRRKITEREAIVTQTVDKSASAGLRTTKIDMMKDIERRTVEAVPLPEPRRLAAANEEVVQLFVARPQRQASVGRKSGRGWARKSMLQNSRPSGGTGMSARKAVEARRRRG